MECLERGANKLLQASLASNTSRTYDTAVKAFNSFRSAYQLQPDWPACPAHIVLFITYCFESGLAPRTISTYVSGLAFYHKTRGWYDVNQLFIVNKVLQGCHRLKKTVDYRAPLTMQMLVDITQLLSQICHDVYEMRLFQAVFSVTFFGLFRVSEVVVTDSDLRRPLQVDDVVISSDTQFILLVLRVSKTNQSGPPTKFKISREQDVRICPVRLMFKYLAIRPKISGPVFCHANGRPLTRSQFSGVLFKTIARSKYYSGNLMTHSFRIGRASQLAALGVPEAALMTMGRWRSHAYKVYIRN